MAQKWACGFLCLFVLAGCATSERVETAKVEPQDVFVRTAEAKPAPAPKAGSSLTPDGLLGSLIRPFEFEAYRESSWDRTGGNGDRRQIEPGETLVIAELEGPGAITHIWCTVAAEEFYSRKLVLRAYWDGHSEPSIEAPLGDFFCVGHGVDRPVKSLPVRVSSEGRARNCFWPMPFRKSARLEVENQGAETVGAFYSYIDYKRLPALPEDALYFHARYRQEWPCPTVDLDHINLDGAENYLLLETEGRGHYVGCNLSITNKASGWWGEGDDFIWIDGEREPRFIGTGSEDYFCDAWGMREIDGLFYGSPICEGLDVGSRCTVYRFHIADPIPFKKSIKVSIEHGHANDRSDDYSSVAYWYQDRPFTDSKRRFLLPPVDERLSPEMLAIREVSAACRQVVQYLAAGEVESALELTQKTQAEYSDTRYSGVLKILAAMQHEDAGRLDEALALYREVAGDEPDTNAGKMAKAAVWRLGDDVRATIVACGDNAYTLYFDGVKLGSGDTWRETELYQSLLMPGKHVLAVLAKNEAGEAGLVLALRAQGLNLVTDESWRVSRDPGERWRELEYDDGAWDAATSFADAAGTPGGDPLTTERVGVPCHARWIWAAENGKKDDVVYLRKVFEVAP